MNFCYKTGKQLWKLPVFFKIKYSRLFTFFPITKCLAIISAGQRRLCSALIIRLCTCNYGLSVGCAADQGRCAVSVLWLGKSSRRKGGNIRVSNKEYHHCYCQQVINKYVRGVIMQPCPQVERVKWTERNSTAIAVNRGQQIWNPRNDKKHKFHSNWKRSAQGISNLLSITCFVTGPTPTLSPSFLMAQAIFEPSLFFPINTPTFLKHSHSTPIHLWLRNKQSVPKRRHIKFRRRGITQKKA